MQTMVEQAMVLMLDGPFSSKMLNIAFSRFYFLNRVICLNGEQVKVTLKMCDLTSQTH